MTLSRPSRTGRARARFPARTLLAAALLAAALPAQAQFGGIFQSIMQMQQAQQAQQEAKRAQEQAARGNNQETWYELQIVALALFTGRDDVARTTLETARAVAGPVDVAPILGTLVELHNATRGNDDAVMEVDAPPSLVVRGVEDRLVQVFRNLLGKKCVYSPQFREMHQA